MQISVNEVLSPTLNLKVGGKLYKINKNPPWEVLAEAETYRNNIFEKVKYNNWLSEREAISLLIHEKIIPEDYDNQLKNIEESLDILKKNLYQSRLDDKAVSLIRKKIKGTFIMYTDLLILVHSLDYVTLKYYLDYMEEIFLIINTVDRKISFDLAEAILAKKNKQQLSQIQIRNIAKTNPWKSYWAANKPNAIKHNILNYEQTSLIMFSKMYDSIYEHPECPDEDVIQDNDMLDGWLLLTKEKQNREKKTRELENKNPKMKNATEVFLPAKNKTDINNINALNTDNAKSKKMAREQMIKHNPEIQDIDFAKRGLLVK